MKNVLYFPYMNLPFDCPVIGSSLLFADNVNMIAPYNAVIQDKRTKDLFEHGLLTKIDPGRILTYQEYEEVADKLSEYLALRKQVGNEDFLEVQYEKLFYNETRGLRQVSSNIDLHTSKLGEPIFRVLHNHKYTNFVNDGIGLPSDVALYVLGLISSIIQQKENLELVSSLKSHNSLSRKNIANQVLFNSLSKISIELMPRLKYENLSIEEIVKIRKNYRKDISEYVFNVQSDLNYILNKELNKNIEDPQVTSENIEIACVSMVECYKEDLKKFERDMNSQKKRVMEKCVLGVVVPLVFAPVPLIGPYVSAFSVALSLTIPKVEIPQKIQNQKIIYTLNQRN